MYRKKSRGWYKHKDFIFIDLVCLLLSLILAYLVRNGSVRNLFELGIYHNMIFFVILADLFLIIIFESYKGVLRRGYYQELRSVIQQMILIELASGLYLFTVSNGHSFSRTVLYLMGVFYVLLSYGTRIIWKKHLIHKMAEGGEHSLYIVTNYDLASKVIQNVKNHNYNRYNINGLIIVDKNIAGREIEGIPVVADLENAASYICQQWVDEVFVNVDTSCPYPHELINELLEMGMAVHVNLAKVRSTPGQKQFVETIGGYTVLTTTMNYATDRQALAKRTLDILGGLVGCLLTGIIFIFVAPAIYISSPGPIFFSQIRIGQNGKPFKMYKFRSMYMDAEERRAELMAQNKMSDGRMFKIDFDPRVIGNKILPDGTRKTGIGEFIRKTSLDEFPQFWNVLNGTMSLVGTRPILQDELQKYELHHRARIAIKPGITGMWQVSGRSDMKVLMINNLLYGRSKKAGEELFFDYAKETGAKVAVYRFPNLMGHSRPKYNSAVSTFCWAVANDEPFTVNDRSTEHSGEKMRVSSIEMGRRFCRPYGMSTLERSRASVNSYLPYTKIIYKMKESSVGADREKLYRERKKAVAEMAEEPSADNLWNAIVAFQGYPFKTSKGLSFTYKVKGGELFFTRKEKSITRSTVDIAFQKALELGEKATGPKKLGVFGASYLYPVFVRLGVINKRWQAGWQNR